MLISENDGVDLNFFASKEAHPIVRQLEKITVKKVEAKVVKCAKNKSWVPRNPPWSLKCQLFLLKQVQYFAFYIAPFH